MAVSSIFSIVDLIGYGLTLGIAAAASVTLAIVTAAGLAMANIWSVVRLAPVHSR